MKAVHHNRGAIDVQLPHQTEDWMHKARNAESVENWEEAAKAYEKVVAGDKLNEFAYNRLMIIYRKQKALDHELKIIDKAISAYQKFYASKLRKKSRTVTEISAKLNQVFGLTDKNGKARYDPEPIAAWKKRMTTLKKKLK